MSCIFCDIVEGKIPADKVYEDEYVIAFNDINPASPNHVLIIPKEHTNNIYECNTETLQHMHDALKRIVDKLGVLEDGFRVVLNTNDNGGQTVHHLHMHVLAGRFLQWPPG